MPRSNRARPGAPQGGAAAGRPACDCECACAGCGSRLLALPNWVCPRLSRSGRSYLQEFGFLPESGNVLYVTPTYGPLRTKSQLNVMHAFCGLHALLRVIPGIQIPLSSVLKLHARLALRPQRKKIRNEVWESYWWGGRLLETALHHALIEN